MASGYDISSRIPFRLMQGRLGVYDKRPFDPNKVDKELEGIEHQSTRLRQQGGHLQQERMIRDKRRSLNRAVWNSYQAAEIVRTDAEHKKPFRALINPNKLKQDYDDKIVSCGFEYNLQPGSVFEWVGTNTHWLVYLQDLTELAYFRGDIRKCSYEVEWEDENGKHSTYLAIRGPVETKINFIQKHGVSIDTPNHSLHILMPLNEDTLKQFQRYNKFYLQSDNMMMNINPICWRVEALDWISTPGILEINAVEYYANLTEDDLKEGIVGGLVVKTESPNSPETEAAIMGETFIKVKKTYEYEFSGEEEAEWIIDSKYPIKIIVDELNSKKIQLKWDSSYSGQFDLYYGDYKKTIVVESLF